MGIRTEWITYGAAREHTGYAAWPDRARLPLPGIVVLHDVWGLDEQMQGMTRRLAAAGYGAFAPDLFAAGRARPPELSRARLASLLEFVDSERSAVPLDRDALQRRLESLPGGWGDSLRDTLAALCAGDRLAPERYIPAATTTVHWLRTESALSQRQKVLAVGYGLGGSLAILLASEPAMLDGAVLYHGSPPPLDDARRVSCPLLGFYGAADERVAVPARALASAMPVDGLDFELHSYDGAGRAFFNDARPTYVIAAARDAFARTLAFLRDQVA